MAAQNEINTCLFEDGQCILAHVGELRIRIRVVRTLTVRRVVPVGDDPLCSSRNKVAGEPGHHRTGTRSTLVIESRHTKWMLP